MKFSKKVLANGLRFLAVPMQGSPTATILVLVEAGSKYETKEKNGISHFLEHMLFKGTKKRPKAFDIARELDAIGAEYNAFTSQEFTGYFAKADYKHFTKILDVVSDIFKNSTLPDDEIEREKGVIIEEINMYQDLPQKHVQDLFFELLYGDSPAGRNIAGTKDSVRSFTREGLVSYRRQHYVGVKTAVVVAGNLSEGRVRSAMAAFGDLPAGQTGVVAPTLDFQEIPQALSKAKATDQTHLVLGVRALPLKDPRLPALRLLSAILGGGMSSRLFQRIREEMGACYYINATAEAFFDHGFLAVSAGAATVQEEAVVAAIIEELGRLRWERVKAGELKDGKEYLSGTLYLNLESSDEVADFFGFQEITRWPLKLPKEVVALIQKVSADDIQKLANDIFVEDRLNLALIGGGKNGQDFLPLLKF